MRITASDVSMLGVHVKDTRHFEQRKVSSWTGELLGGSPPDRPGLLGAAHAQISDLGHLLSSSEPYPASRGAPSKSEPGAVAGAGFGEKSFRTLQLDVMRLVLEKIMGTKVWLPEPNGSGSGIEYETDTLDLGTETSGFSASGVVRTTDGREIAFDLTLERQGEHTDLNGSSRPAVGSRPMIGPLVFNSAGQVANLTEETFAFDLDADGEVEKVALLREGSAYLVLDRNADGVINDGSELFGPSSGHGFAELAAHDVDGNGWIDEADPVFARLRLWAPDSGGAGSLSGLAETGIGAISLDHRETPFDLHDDQDRLRGAVHSTGVFLAEDGTPGTIEQIDVLA